MHARVAFLRAGSVLLLLVLLLTLLLAPQTRAEDESSGPDDAAEGDAPRAPGLLLVFGDAEFVGDEVAMLAGRTPPLGSMAGFSYLAGWVDELRIDADLRALAAASDHDAAAHGLAAATRRVLATTPGPVLLHVVLPGTGEASEFAMTSRTLRAVADAFARGGGDGVRVHWIDAATDDGRSEVAELGLAPTSLMRQHAGEFTITRAYAGVIVDLGGERRVLGDLFHLPPHTIEREIAIAITGAADLVEGEVGLVVPPAAEGAETRAFSTLRALLERNVGGALHPDLDLGEPVPPDVRVLVVAAPTELPSAAATHLEAHLDRGNHAILLLDPVRWSHLLLGHLDPIASGFEDWLAGMGVEVAQQVACDPPRCAPAPVPVETEEGRRWTFVTTPAWPYAPPEGPAWFRSLARGRSPEFTYLFPVGLRVRADADEATRSRIQVLAATTESGYLAPPTPPSPNGPGAPPDGAERGRIPVALLVERPVR